MARRGTTGKITMPFWRGVPPKSDQIDINAINVGFATTLILVLFIIGIVTALAKVETQAPTAHTERMPESPLYLTVTTDLTLWLGNEAIGNILWRSHGGHEPPVQ